MKIYSLFYRIQKPPNASYIMRVIKENERSLLNRASNFDASALSEIYDCHQEALYRYAMRLLGDPQLAEDCVAETFFRFLRSLSNGNLPRENLRAYLFQIAHNWITDHYRRNQSRFEVTLEENKSAKNDTVEEVENELQRAIIREAILTLTPDQQLVIILKYFEGFQNEDIARNIGKRVGAVKALLHRSLASLKKKIPDQGL